MANMLNEYFVNIAQERKQSQTSSVSFDSSKLVTWDQALFSFRFENYIPASMAKRKESLIQTFYETSAAHFFDWLTFAESANFYFPLQFPPIFST